MIDGDDVRYEGENSMDGILLMAESNEILE